MRFALLVIVLWVATVITGCTKPGAAPQTTSPGDGPTVPATSAPTTTPAPIPKTLPFNLSLSACHLLVHTLYVKDDVYRPEYPPGVQPASAGHEESVQWAGMDSWTCQQADSGAGIQDNFQFFAFYGLINPPNPEATEITTHYFLFQSYSNSPVLVESAKRDYGLEISLVENVTITRAPVSPPPQASFSYELKVAKGAQTDYAITGHHWESQEVPREEVDGYYFLNSNGELNHFRITYSGNSRGSSGGTVEFGPNSYWGQRADVYRWDFVNLPHTDITAQLQFFDGI